MREYGKAYIIEDSFVANGMLCVVTLSHLGHRCGYVGVKDDHPLFNVDYTDADVGWDIHGGLTYSGGRTDNYPVPGNWWWFGFDCAHYCDSVDIVAVEKAFPELTEFDRMNLKAMLSSYGIVRTHEYVREECTKLAHELWEYCAEKKRGN